ncbi:MAG TPA: TonB-dependent receptor [Thermoanaerobaculia bacterium]|nr:TonB-dependent receptor [Thermoanaerobaculia bacterium]
MKRLVILLSVLLVAVTGPAFAQSTTGTIEVIVSDSSGAPLPGVTVTASASDTNTRRTEVTGADGTATLVSLQPSSRYTVETSLEGFGKSQNTNVLVRSAQTATVRVTLQMASVSESITVTADAPIVDTTSAVVGEELTLELTESLPTGRSYQSYLQLVPGVLPASVTAGGNPASRSGVNYSDIGGNIGQSTDNFYYVEGINVTDPLTGTFGANLNTEIIQEQKVMTGGIPAEFAGAPGLLSSVVTKSGSNNFTGSVNYYTQNDNLVADNKVGATGATFSTYDSAATLGGPIVRDKAWFFGSYRILNTETDVVTNTGTFLRTVTNEGTQAYGKLSWQVTSKDRFSGTFTNDPTEISGSTISTTLNTRSSGQKQGGDRYSLEYNRVFSSNFLLDAAAGKHNGEVSTVAQIQETLNTVVFRREDNRPLSEQQLGGAGANNISERDSEFVRGSLEGIFDTGFGSHTVKLGLEQEDHINFRNNQFVNGAQYNSIGAIYAGTGVSAAEVTTSGAFNSFTFNPGNVSDRTGFLDFVNNRIPAADRQHVYALLDTDHDGVLSTTELLAMRFQSTTGNPNGAINYRRVIETASGPQETKTEGQTMYLQDTIQLGRFAINAGVRGEKWEHVATTGENIFTFDWEYAPRLSVIYDLLGNGRQKVSGYYGRYYDPIRLNLTNFAGTLTGQVLDEQVFVGDRWITYRTRGGPVVQDAFFAPTTKTPYTDELQFGYQVDLGNNMSFETSLYRRQTRDIIEDYDLTLYADPAHPEAAGDFYLGLEYFGYDSIPPSNFVIATLAGGERNTDGIDLVFRKRYANNWQALVSYTFTDAEGNTNSDSNADFAGDVLFLDPRAPNVYGTQPGSIDHLFKVAGSYKLFNRLELGGVYNWNSGSHASLTAVQSARNLPLQVHDAYVFGNVEEFWVEEGAVGGLTNNSFGILDLRAAWSQPLPRSTSLELFLDIFNVLDDQEFTRNQDLVAGQGPGLEFGQGLSTFAVQPRRFYLGARFLF